MTLKSFDASPYGLRLHHVSNHQCRTCRPIAFLDGPRLGEHHIAVRFGDANVLPRLEVFVNGVILTNCTEALAGDPGRVWIYPSLDGRLHLCSCGSQRACELYAIARVEIRTRLA